MSDLGLISIHDAEFRAQEDEGRKNFLAFFPAGPKCCKWLDPYMGLFTIDDMEGFVTTAQVARQFPKLQVLEMKHEDQPEDSK